MIVFKGFIGVGWWRYIGNVLKILDNMFVLLIKGSWMCDGPNGCKDLVVGACRLSFMAIA